MFAEIRSALPIEIASVNVVACAGTFPGNLPCDREAGLDEIAPRLVSFHGERHLEQCVSSAVAKAAGSSLSASWRAAKERDGS